MATTNQIKFYKSSVAPSAPSIGAIWFNTTNRTVNVYVGGEELWQKYAGLVDASWSADGTTLTITNATGATATLDISKFATLSSVNASLESINSTLTTHDGRITAAQNAADAAQGEVDALEIVVEGVKATADAAAVKAEVNAALELKADKTQVETDIATAKQAAIDDAAADATSKANAAQAAAIAEATRLDGLMDARVDALEAAVGTGGSVDEAITAKIEDLDADVTSAEGTQVRVQVVEVDGKITEVKVTESATFATAKALSDEIADREADEETINNRINALDAAETGRVSALETKVAALASATHFLGVKDSLDDVASPVAGDIVIVGDKEYVYDDVKGWIELGDTTAEQGRISALEDLVGSTSVDAQIDAKIAALSDEAKSSEDANLVKVTVSQADGNVTGVSLDDSKLDEAIAGLDGKIVANTAAAEANAAAIKVINETTVPGINDRLDGLDDDVERIDGVLATLATSDVVTGINNRLTQAEADIDALEEKNGEQDTAIAAADAKGAQGIADAAAALAEAQAKVASVTAGNYVSVGNDAKNPVVSVNVVGSIAEGNTGLVTGGAIFNELCWVEFE